MGSFCFAMLLSQHGVLSPVVILYIDLLPTTQDFLCLNLLGEQGGQIDSSQDRWVPLCLLVLAAR